MLSRHQFGLRSLNLDLPQKLKNVFKAGLIVFLTLASLMAVSTVAGAPTDITRGLVWLQAAVQNTGELTPQSIIATPEQSKCETATTLLKLAADNARVAALIGTLQAETDDAPTQSLACKKMLQQGLAQSTAQPNLNTAKVGAQGWAAFKDFDVANALDTGWALSAELNYLSSGSKATALAWLQSIQQTDGSFATAGSSDVFATAVVLRALNSGASSKDPVAAAIASKAADYLLGTRTAGAGWFSDIATTALVFEAVHPYSGKAPSAAKDVEAALLDKQLADGSWDGDPYVTALALRALKLTSIAPVSPSAATLKVQFLDAQSNLPLASVQLTIEHLGTKKTLSATAEGKFDITDLEPGAYTLTTMLVDYSSANISVNLPAGQVADLGQIRLVKNPQAITASLSGTVRDAKTGEGISGATVLLTPQNSIAQTDAQGQYFIANVQAGGTTISVQKTGYIPASTQVNIQSGQTVMFSPTLISEAPNSEAGCVLFGTLLNAVNKSPEAGVLVTLDDGNIKNISTDSNGFYSISNIRTGLVHFVAQKAGFDSITASFDVICSSSSQTSIKYSPVLYATGQTPPLANLATLAGVVVDAQNNAPISGVLVKSDLPSVKSVTSDSNGAFRLEGLPGTLATITLSTAGYSTHSAVYVFDAAEENDIGQIRLGQEKLQHLLPDLALNSVARSTARTDAQDFVLSGEISVNISNKGTLESIAGLPVIAFADNNANEKYDEGSDVLLAQASLPQLKSNENITFNMAVQGSMSFRDAPIYVMIDPEGVNAESNKSNNLKSTADAIQILPTENAFLPKLKWHWNGQNSPYPTFNQVMMAPVVGRILDTNGDGLENELDTPTVVFHSFSSVNYTGPSVLRLVNGKTGEDILSIRDDRISAVASPAIADLYKDGSPVILTASRNNKILSYRNDGSFLWESEQASPQVIANNSLFSSPYVVDLDGDGAPEIIYGNLILNANGSTKWEVKEISVIQKMGRGGELPIAADLYGIGKSNVIIGGAIYGHDGVLIWESPYAGFPAVADFEGKGKPFIVLVSGSQLVMLDPHTKSVRWVVNIPGGGGGPPTIADLDGDGIPEIGVAGAYAYSTYRADGSIFWSRNSQDYSSRITGSTVFDFDGAGSADVLYADELRFRVYKGKNGVLKWEIPNPSGTVVEYPLVVDVDGSGSSKIVLVSNNYHFSGVTGVRVFESSENAWAGTRSLWNQHAYNISNINDDLTVPAQPAASWKVHNTYRLNKRLDVDPKALPDATVGYVRIQDGGGESNASLQVRIGNAGSYKVAAGTWVTVYASNPTLGQPSSSEILGQTQLPSELLSNQYLDLDFLLNRSLSQLQQDLWVVVDDDGRGKHALQDFDRSNNTVSAKLSDALPNISLTVSTDRAVYAGNAQAVFTAPVSNGGSLDRDVLVRFTVLDTQGAVVATLPLGPAVPVASGKSATAIAIWPISHAIAGAYQVTAELVTVEGLIYGEATAGFVVQGDVEANQTNKTHIATDRASYSSTDSIQITSQTTNTSGNVVQNNLTAVTTVSDSLGQVLFSKAEPITQFGPGANKQYHYSFSANGLAIGTHSARIELKDASGATLSEHNSSFNILSSAQTGAGIKGTIGVLPKAVDQGSKLNFSFAIDNLGNTDLNATQLKVLIVHPDTDQLLATLPYIADLLQGKTYVKADSWKANAPEGAQLVAVLAATINGKDITLAQDGFTVTAPPIQLDPITGGIGSDLRVLVLATCPLDVKLLSQGIGGLLDVPLTEDIKLLDAAAMNYGWKASDTACDQHRAIAIEDYLRDLGVNYKVVTTAESWRYQMRTGAYNTYWISGPAGKIPHYLMKELREAIWRGDSLIQDGQPDPRNWYLNEAAGVFYAGQYWHSNQAVTVQDATPFEVRQLATRGNAIKYILRNSSHANGEAVAQFAQQNYCPTPAIIRNRFGAGQSVLFAFDLAQMIANEHKTSRIPQNTPMVATLIDTLVQTANQPVQSVAGDTIPLTVSIKNTGAKDTLVYLQATLPTGLTHSSSSIAPVQITPAQNGSPAKLSWKVSVAAQKTATLTWRVQASQPGDFILPFAASAAAASNASVQLPQPDFSIQLKVQDRGQVLQQARNSLTAYNPSNPLYWPAKTAAWTALEVAQSEQYYGRPESALLNWMNAANALRLSYEPAMNNALTALAWGAHVSELSRIDQLQCVKRSFGLSSPQPKLGSSVGMSWTVTNQCAGLNLLPWPITASVINRNNEVSLYRKADAPILLQGRGFTRSENWLLGLGSQATAVKAGDILDARANVIYDLHDIELGQQWLTVQPK